MSVLLPSKNYFTYCSYNVKLSLLKFDNSEYRKKPAQLMRHMHDILKCVKSALALNKVAGVADPCKSDLVISMKEWTPRSIGRFTIRIEPITPDIIKNIVAIYGKPDALNT
jgi:hypothetical protein